MKLLTIDPGIKALVFLTLEIKNIDPQIINNKT